MRELSQNSETGLYRSPPPLTLCPSRESRWKCEASRGGSLSPWEKSGMKGRRKPPILSRTTIFGPRRLSSLPPGFCHLLTGLMVLAALLGCVPQQGASSGKVAQTVQSHYRMGINYLNEGKSPQAIKELLTAQSLATNNADVEHALGLAFQQKGLYDKAVEQYQKALTIDPKLTEARNNMGTALLALGKYDEAIEQFEICMKDPAYTTPEKAAYNLGVAYFKKEDLDRAIEQYQKAIALSADNPNAMYNLAFCLEKRKNFAQALEYYKKALAADSSFKEAHYRMALIYEEQSNPTAAITKLNKVLELDPDHLPAQFRMGMIFLKQGSVEKALKRLETVARADPGSALGKEAIQEIAHINRDKFKGIPKQSLR